MKQKFRYTFFSLKYNHKITLEDKQKHNHIPLYQILSKKLDAIKYFFDIYFVKKFI